jgi:nitrogen fixation protein FixH
MTPAPVEITGRHVLLALVSFFAVIITVNVAMAVLASRSWTGLVVENGYVASQHFNEDLAEARRQAALGWTETLRYLEGELVLELRDAEGRGLEGLRAEVKLERPSTDRDDHMVALADRKDGRYAGPATLGPGQWTADVIVRGTEGQVFRRIHRLRI